MAFVRGGKKQTHPKKLKLRECVIQYLIVEVAKDEEPLSELEIVVTWSSSRTQRATRVS
ncbi:hypothetical protein M7I_6708 [Glarea lozoyensis 74030]|uniref:Uncharacterized protein n=1 Tax=Glarea lozoyensis (strain ATCC 74030 / MF5533) TaxID=1104152 RepID=H0EVB3_GLAL7|nr:hypothetical protein M7I_6708 [Glarea lozoyensis 74030]